MKKILTFLFVLATMNLFAQTEKGGFMVGGGASVVRTIPNNSTTSGATIPTTTSYGISPTAGYFVINNLAVGTALSFSHSNFNYNNGSQDIDGRNNSFGFGPFARYYVPVGKVFFISEAAYSWARNNSKTTGNSTGPSENSSTLTNFRLAAGTAIFLNQNASIDLLLNYRRYDHNTNQSSVFLSVGFQLYLRKK